MKRLLWSVGLALLTLLHPAATTRADELQELPTATPESSVASMRAAPRLSPASEPAAVIRIASVVPTYIDRGIVMVPLRPLAQFLGLRIRNVLGVLVLERLPADGSASVTRLMFRNGSTRGQIKHNGVTRFITLPIPAQTRLGNTFVSARVVSAAFGATSQAVPEEKGIILGLEGHRGLFSSIVPNGYRGDDAARVVIENNVGRTLSLHLRGPQNVFIELGSREWITHNLRPGIYNFQAASSGMKTRSGVRRFAARQRAVWNWGRK